MVSQQSRRLVSPMFRKAVILLLVLLTPFAQARVVLACSMNETPVERCACPHAQHHSMSEQQGGHRECCDIVIEASEREFATSSVTSASVLPVIAPWADVPTVLIELIEASPAQAPTDVAATAQRSALLAMANSPPLYLHTARLRL